VSKIAGIAALILGALFITHPAPAAVALPAALPTASAFAAAMVGVLWSFGGWQYATFPAGEVRAASRTIPISILAGVGIVLVLYIGVNLAYQSVLPADVMAAEPRTAALTAERLIGPAGGSLISVLIAMSAFGTASVYTLAAPRIYYAMARDGLFFPAFGKLHPKYGTPLAALAVQCAIVIVFILAGGFETLISYVTFVDWIFYAAAAGTVFVFRRSLKDAPRQYKTPGYPFTPLLFIAVSLCFVFYLFLNEPVNSAIGLGILISGLPISYIWKRKSGRRRNPSESNPD
jgi:basic amino acid/polyamine antiporter, APA family